LVLEWNADDPAKLGKLRILTDGRRFFLNEVEP